MSGRRPSTASLSQSPALDSALSGEEDPEHVEDVAVEDEPSPEAKVAEKFFIVKSLTLQDLEQSVRNGIWATQSHNEHALNKAFEVCTEFYFLFVGFNIL
jgi:hypothetical protein